jgi:LmbE family N-acetylglucosaminyl deacetylase
MFKLDGDKIRNVLVFGAHPDDEIIGPGGTIARLSDEGANVTVVTFTAGETAYSTPDMKDKMGDIRMGEARACDEILGIDQRIVLGLPCQGVTNDTDTYQRCVKIIREVQPDLILSHTHRDKHRDHRTIAQIVDEVRWKATESVLSDMGEPWYCSYMFYYEIMELFTEPSFVVDISGSYDRKVRAMETQTTQVDMMTGIMRHIEGLAKARGFLAGCDYAEAFQVSNRLPGRI